MNQLNIFCSKCGLRLKSRPLFFIFSADDPIMEFKDGTICCNVCGKQKQRLAGLQ